jgi:plastocyanin
MSIFLFIFLWGRQIGGTRRRLTRIIRISSSVTRSLDERMMLRYFAILAATSVAAVLGQTMTASDSPASATATHTIKVGFPVGQHTFSPENTQAQVGDTLGTWQQDGRAGNVADSVQCSSSCPKTTRSCGWTRFLLAFRSIWLGTRPTSCGGPASTRSTAPKT